MIGVHDAIQHFGTDSKTLSHSLLMLTRAADARASLDASGNDHPRTIGWIGTTALAMGGSNQSLFLIAALFVGQGGISGQGSAAIPLLLVGLLLSLAAAPGWIELVMLSPNRVGGIAASCNEAFRSYSPVVSSLAGVCYWWGWVPTCGLTALLSASAIHQWYLPGVPTGLMATGLVLFFAFISICGLKWVTRLAVPIASVSSALAFLSCVVPVVTDDVDWRQAVDFHLTVPFGGWFGEVTSMMAGLYLIGFAAPAFEAATCHVGETFNPKRNVPRAVFASAAMAVLYFAVLPVVWFGVLGPEPLGHDLAFVLGPTFAPLFGGAAKSVAIWFMVFAMFHGTLQPLAGAARTLAQLSEDGLVPRFLAIRSRSDAPWVATLLTAGMAILFLIIGDPIWLIASANFTYLIGICLPSIAVWLLRRNQPDLVRPYRAPRGTILLGLGAAGIWALSAVLGFQQFGLPTVLIGLVFAYSGAALYAWRRFDDRQRLGLPGIARTLHLKLTGAMLLVLVLDGAGYLIAVGHVAPGSDALTAALEDIFVAVAILSITVGVVLPGMIAHAATELSQAANRLVTGTVADFSRAMKALAHGDLDAAHARVDFVPVTVNSRDEVGDMAISFNLLQQEIASAAISLDEAREGLREARTKLRMAKEAAEKANIAKSHFLANMSHELRTPLNAIIGFGELIHSQFLGPLGNPKYQEYAGDIEASGKQLLRLINDILDISKTEAGEMELRQGVMNVREVIASAIATMQVLAVKGGVTLDFEPVDASLYLYGDSGRLRLRLLNLLSNAVKFTNPGGGARLAAGLAANGDLELAVTDTGIGIAEQDVSRALAQFGQIDSTISRKYQGSGIGLPLSGMLLELHGGSLRLESVFGAGTTATAVFPAGRVSRIGGITVNPKTHRL